MKIAFRADTRKISGGGHFFRCLNLAKVLKSKKNKIRFIIDKSNDNYKKILINNNIKYFELSKNNNSSSYQEADLEQTSKILIKEKTQLLIVDNYNLNKFWENKIKEKVEKIFVIDDLDRSHNCHYYLNQNISAYKEIKKKLPKNCKTFLGLKYCIINPSLKRKKLKKNKKGIKKLLVFMGMTDSANITLKILKILSSKKFSNFKLNIVVGVNNSNLKKIIKLSKKRKKTKIYFNLKSMGEVIKKSDLAISSGGTFLWECIYLGIPSLVVNYSKKNFKNSDYLRKINCLKVIGSKNISEIQLKKNLNRSMSNLNFLNSWQISKIIDGYGVQRIKQKVLNF